MMKQVKAYARGFQEHLRIRHKHNILTLRKQPFLEMSGAFGDLGTFIPIFVALVSAEQVSAPATLVFSGIANILTGIVFGIPLPVQPMKAIAAIALQKDLSNAEIAGAGLFVAGSVGMLSVLGLLDWFMRVVPVPVVKGIQVGAGLSLMLSAFSKNVPPSFIPGFELGLQVGLLVLTLAFLLLYTLHPRVPFVLIVVIVSVLAGLLTSGSYDANLSIWHPGILVPSGPEFLNGALTAGLGQLPLTTLNSVLAVAVLSQDLFPAMLDQGSLPSAGQIGTSVTLMNIVSLWFRAMPLCHGSGGLAAQYRFGARSGASVILLGSIKLVLGLFAAELVISWCRTFSDSGAAVLGVLVFLAGLELAKMGQNLNSKGARDLWDGTRATQQEEHLAVSNARESKVRFVSGQESMRRWTIMIVTIGSLLGAKNDGVGFVVGMAVHWAYQITDWYHSRDQGSIRLESAD